MGSSSSSQASSPPAAINTPTAPLKKPPNHPTGLGLRSLCPVKPSAPPSISGQQSSSSSTEHTKPECPVKGTGEYNVYSQPIINGLPNTRQAENELPNANQNMKLSTTRVQSSIPKGNESGTSTSSTWTYPSPQMFWNSLNRKGKVAGTAEKEMDVVVAIHNNMNESTWSKVLEWEDVVSLNCFANSSDRERSESPRLLKFIGRPTDISPKAYFKSTFLGHPLPFDRHDWTVQTEGGRTQRYVIDYYVDEDKANHAEGSGMVNKDDRGKINSILVDVRPAILDSVSGFWPGVIGRGMIMPLARAIGKTKFEPLEFFPSEGLKKQKGESMKTWEGIIKSAAKDKDQNETNATKEELSAMKSDLSENQLQDLAVKMNKIKKECKKEQKAVDKCKNDSECAQASLGLALCAGKTICTVQRNAVLQVLHNNEEDGDKMDVALSNLMACVQRGGLSR